LPSELQLRAVRIRVKQHGFRSRTIVVVTTLLDANEFPADEIAELFRRRWQAELQLRSLKAVLQMDHLRGARGRTGSATSFICTSWPTI